MLYVNPLSALETAAASGQDSPARDKVAFQEMERLFLFTLMREMRKTIPEDGLLGGGQERAIYEEMLDDSLSGQWAARGELGIAQQMEGFLVFLQKMIEGEKQSGYLRADVDVGIAAYNFCALYFFVLIGFFRDPGASPESAVETLEAMTQQYMQGILSERRSRVSSS